MSTIFSMNTNAWRSLSHSIWAQTTDWRNGPTAPGSELKAPKYTGLPWQTAVFRRVCAEPVYAVTFVVGLVELIVRGFFGLLSWVFEQCLPEGEFKESLNKRVVVPLLDGAIVSGVTGVYFSPVAFFYNLQSDVI